MEESKKEELGNKHFDLLIDIAYITRQVNDLKKEVIALERENRVKMEELDKIDLEMEMIESKEQKHIN